MATVKMAADVAGMEVLASNADMKKDDGSAGDKPEVRRMSVTPQLKRRSSPTLDALADIDLVELSLLDVLTQAATDILGSISAQRCIVYMYDKASNLLRPQVVVEHDDTDSNEAPETNPIDPSNEAPPEANTVNSLAEWKNNVSNVPLVSFPPVVGMVSSCFLQRRCLRMQEPNPHRAFHREYDVPKDMLVDSILCAPVILYRRAAAVIQLINRVDLTAEHNLVEEMERPATPRDTRNDVSSEVKLRRLKTIKSMALTGFSTKDEQKLLHFTTHVAQTIEMNTKKVANGRSHAKLREDKAKQALNLLNALNGKVVARLNSTEMLLPTESDVTEHMGRSVYLRRTSVARVSPQKGELTDMLGALVVIMRLQAIFRGRRQRRADKFAEELAKFGRQRDRMKTLVVMQRMIPAPEEAKPRVHEKPVTPQVNRKEGSRQSSRIRAEEPKKSSQSPTKLPPKPSSPPQPPPPSPEPTRIQRRKMSATKIQTVYRRQRKRRQTATPVHVEELSKEISSAVKVQSFIRGNLVRKRLRRALLSLHSPHIVCLRVVSSSSEAVSNQTSHDSPRSMQLRSQTCVYAMPERPGKVPLLQRRSSPQFSREDGLDPYQPEAPGSRGVTVESRRLAAIQKADETFRFVKFPVRRSRPRWNRVVSSVVWETPGLELSPPGVEFVRHRRPMVYQEPEKVSSFRATTVAVDTETTTLDKPRVRLPSLASQTRRDAGKSSLLCCLLPAQTKRLASEIAPIPVRPIAPMGRKEFKAKRRQSSSQASALAVSAMCSSK